MADHFVPKCVSSCAWFEVHVCVCVQTKEHVFQSRACAEYAKLRTVQAELEQETGQSCFLGCSVIETGSLSIHLLQHMSA